MLRAVDVSKDLNQQTEVVSGDSQAQDVGVALEVNKSHCEGQRGVNEGHRETENADEAPPDVVLLEEDQNPVQEALPPQPEQQSRQADVHVHVHLQTTRETWQT